MGRLASCFTVVMALYLSACSSCTSANQFMHLYGYTELKPPSTLLAPGAMVAVVSKEPYVAKIICGPRASLGSGYKPIESDTANSTLKKQTNRTFNLDADMLQQITANAEFSGISDISVSLSNARIAEVQDTDIFESMKFRSDDCASAIAYRRRAGFEVSMISSALVADIQYNVSWSATTKMSAQAKLDALSNLAVRLGGGASSVSTSTIQASGLAIGIRDDAYLSAIALKDVDERRVKRGSRVLSKTEAPIMDIQPDAPVVYPTDGQDGPPQYCDIHGNCTDGAKPVIGPPPIETRHRT